MWVQKWQRALIAIGALAACAQTPRGIADRVTQDRMCLADLRNHWYTVVFPKQAQRSPYGGESEYLYSVVSPNGRSLFASRREFNARGNVHDTLIRRQLTSSGAGPEEAVPVPFSAFFQFAVSSNEAFLVIAGRLQDPTVDKDKRDGIFVFDRRTGALDRIAPYTSLGQDVRSLNVDDRGDVVIYEDKGNVLTFTGTGGSRELASHHPGKFPALMPDGRGYIYTDGRQLILHEREAERVLLKVPNVVGAIRVSPNSQFIAFGVDLFGDLSSTKLRVCELKAMTCEDGPRYADWIAGRETFWIQW